MANQCEYCGAEPALYPITEEDGERVFLCRECREDSVEVLTLWDRITEAALRRSQDAQVPDCGIREPHAPGAHPPAIDLEPEDEEESDESYECDDEEEFDPVDRAVPAAWLPRLLQARAALLRSPATMALAAALGILSLGFTLYFWATGHGLLAFLA